MLIRACPSPEQFSHVARYLGTDHPSLGPTTCLAVVNFAQKFSWASVRLALLLFCFIFRFQFYQVEVLIVDMIASYVLRAKLDSVLLLITQFESMGLGAVSRVLSSQVLQSALADNKTLDAIATANGLIHIARVLAKEPDSDFLSLFERRLSEVVSSSHAFSLLTSLPLPACFAPIRSAVLRHVDFSSLFASSANPGSILASLISILPSLTPDEECIALTKATGAILASPRIRPLFGSLLQGPSIQFDFFIDIQISNCEPPSFSEVSLPLVILLFIKLLLLRSNRLLR